MNKSKKKVKAKPSGRIKNRRAGYDYALEDGFTFGMVLNGRQTRAIRNGNLSLAGSYISFKDGSLSLLGLQLKLPKTSNAKENLTSSDPIRLLATKQDIAKISSAKMGGGRTIIPTEILTKTRFIKVRGHIGKGKREFEKRESKKQTEFKRQRTTKNFKDL